MAKELKKMRETRYAITSLRLSLKQQEYLNQKTRERITPIWNNKGKEPLVKELSNGLVVGRAKVRAYQAILHSLKNNVRAYNKSYDLSNR